MKMSKYGIVLGGMCLLDVAVTAIGIALGEVTEMHPVLRFYLLHGGILGLVAAKTWMNACSIFVLEVSFRTVHADPIRYCRISTPGRIKAAYITAIAIYLFIFVGGSFYTTFS